MSTGPLIATSIALATATLLFYGIVLRVGMERVRPLTELVAGQVPMARQYTLREVDAMVRLGVGAALNAAFAIGALAVSSVTLANLGLGLRPDLLVLGAVLGVGEVALATFVAYLAVSLALEAGHGRPARDVGDWLTLSRGGWMRPFFQLAAIAPTSLLAVSLVFIAAEELVFRGVMITLLANAGWAWALAFSAALFAAVQGIGMPSWQSALFPVVGALILGLVHGALFLVVPALLPLVIAHWVFFLVVLV